MVSQYRILSSSLQVVESSNGKSWKKSSVKFPLAIEVAKLFKFHETLNLIIDSNKSKFLKGTFSKKPLGARINILPNNQKLNKAYSLFAEDLQIHDETSNSHWDAIFKNPNGQYSYLYTEEKIKISNKKKYQKVNEFAKILPKLKKNLEKNIGEEEIILAMIILLKTKMRVGNEIYYRRSRHKGLTTLKKKNLKISKDKIKFRYIGKDGVPTDKEAIFSKRFILEFKKLLRKKKSEDFIFTNQKGHPIKDIVFEIAFEKYCGKRFYPHIVRSEYATSEALNFLKGKRKISKEEAKEFYLKIAHELGHKKFSKKKGVWEDSFAVTLHHYINPELVEKIEEKIKLN